MTVAGALEELHIRSLFQREGLEMTACIHVQEKFLQPFLVVPASLGSGYWSVYGLADEPITPTPCAQKPPTPRVHRRTGPSAEPVLATYPKSCTLRPAPCTLRPEP